MGNKREKDRELWEKIKKTAKPLDNSLASRFEEAIGKKVPEKTFANAKPTPVKTQTRIIKPWVPERPSVSPVVNEKHLPRLLDDKTTRKIAKGRLELEGRIDLHGMTQAQAHTRLYSFLDSARKSGKRTVLVITGKGKLGEGILRSAVPRWLEEERFRKLVTGYRESHRSHGGDGALYVRVRRLEKP